MIAPLSVFLITLGLGQLISTGWKLRAVSVVGPSRLAGYSLGMLLLVVGALLLPERWYVVWWALPAGPLALGLLLLGGSFIFPPVHPNCLFNPNQAEVECIPVQIPDGEYRMPGFLLIPRPLSTKGQADSAEISTTTSGNDEASRPAVCIIPGAADTKISFKWRMVRALLAEGFTVLTIDPPGHGDYRHRPLAYPDGLSAIPAAIKFLKQQPGVGSVGLIGISMGGAMAIRYLAESKQDDAEVDHPIDALVVWATPVKLKFTRTLFYREALNTLRAPILSIFGEISLKQIRESWLTGGYRSKHNTSEFIDLLNPLDGIRQLKDIPLLLVYGRRDSVSPPETARAMHQAAPHATLIEFDRASHVSLILMPEVNQKVARWLKAHQGVSA